MRIFSKNVDLFVHVNGSINTGKSHKGIYLRAGDESGGSLQVVFHIAARTEPCIASTENSSFRGQCTKGADRINYRLIGLPYNLYWLFESR